MKTKNNDGKSTTPGIGNGKRKKAGETAQDVWQKEIGEREEKRLKKGMMKREKKEGRRV